MEKIKIFYEELTQKQKIIFWIAIGIIVFFFFRIVIWKKTERKVPLNPKIAVKTYLKNLENPDKKKKIHTIYLCGYYKIEESTPRLEEILKTDPDPKIKKAAAKSIGKIDKDVLLQLLNNQDKKVKSIVIDALIQLNKDNVSYLLNRFNEENTETKIKILSFLNNVKYQDKLMEIVENREENLKVRKASIDILKKVATSEIESRLWNLYYNDPEEDIQKAAYETIKAIEKRGEK